MASQLDQYFKTIKDIANEEYKIARNARLLGKDCEVEVEIPQAEDLAGKVQALIGVEASEIIRSLSEKYDRERVAIEASLSVSENFEGSEEEKIEKGIRVGLAILTEGILVAPLEGITGVKVKSRNGERYLAIYYSGPIRSAGGTAQALSVFIGDLLRRKYGIGKYIPTQDEVERCKEEIPLYARVQHLQYIPTLDEIETAVNGSPVCITGEGTEEAEVAGHRDLPDVETNRLRGGMALVIAEGLILKASKLKNYANKFGAEGWAFSKEKVEEKDVYPNFNYLNEMVAGRPALAYPSRKGGFRLRYGRARNTGLAAVAINPITMKVLDNFIAVGTQIKLERPGKAAAVVANENIEGPTVLLGSGTLTTLRDEGSYNLVRNDIKKIVDLGEIMISFGEFIENNKVLFPGAFTPSWWKDVCIKSIGYAPEIHSDKEAVTVSKEKKIPLHPRYTYLWHDVNVEEANEFAEILERDSFIGEGLLQIPRQESVLKFLENILCEYEVSKFVSVKDFHSLIAPLGLEIVGDKLKRKSNLKGNNLLKTLSDAAGFPIFPKGITRIGARMGRPEKAEERRMNPPVHVLFPIGEVAKNRRDLNQYTKLADSVMEIRICQNCGQIDYKNVCENCGSHTSPGKKTKEFSVNIADILREKGEHLGVRIPKKVNGVKGLTSTNKTPEPIEKGVLRAVHSIFPFKDGTCRFDMSDVPLTHVRLSEIDMAVEVAFKLGYATDYEGKELVSTDQIIELFPQDILPSEKAGEYLLRVSNFIDDLLEKFYNLPAHFKATDKMGLIGELVIGLAPHTSGGILGRIIGYTKGDVCYAHPFFHAAKRRNCDGDEDSIMLLLDGLINFSRDYLPESRGGLMDAPLVLSLKIDPREIDKEALNLDITGEYPTELLEMTHKFPNPSEIMKYVRTPGTSVKNGELYPKCSFTDHTESINLGTLKSSYKSIGSMELKLEKQLELAKKLTSVDASDMAERILRYHFIPDIMGNLNKYGSQTFRCTSCNQIYRRLPLSGKCKKCGTNLTGTVHKGNITKYLERSFIIANDFQVSNYVKQRIQILRDSVYSIFDERNNNLKTLEDFDDT